jgi:hypothetical protein
LILATTASKSAPSVEVMESRLHRFAMRINVPGRFTGHSVVEETLRRGLAES